nr:four helix bundle protein [Thiorhodococcus mannitoliphagus]
MLRFEDLEVWKRSARLSVELYKAMSGLRDFGFRDQITRSGLSVPSNIAEGLERRPNKDRQRYIDIALGSCGELRTQIYIGIEIGYIQRQEGASWIAETREISAMLVGLRNNLAKLKTEN